MFGGFDGNFYNDLNILHTNKATKERIKVSASTLYANLAGTVNDPELSDIEFIVKSEKGDSQQVIYANKSLVLYRLIERELRTPDFSASR